MVKISNLPSAGTVNNNFIYPLTDPSDTSSAPSGTTKSSTPVVMAPAIQSNLSDALKSIGALTPAADRLAYYTGAASASLTTLTSFGRSLIAAGDADAAKTALGLAGLATTGITGTLTLTKAGTTARTVTFPDAAGTVAFIDLAQTWAATQTFADVVINTGNNFTMTGGVITDSTGDVTIDDNATVTGTLTVDTIGASAGSVTFINNIILNGVSISDIGSTVSINDNLTVSGVVKASLNATVAMRVSRPATASGVAYAFELQNTLGTSLDYADIACLPTDATAGSEDGSLLFRLRENGTAPATRLTLNNTGVILSSGLDITLNGGVIADSTGTITLDDNTQANGTVTITRDATVANNLTLTSITGTGRQILLTGNAQDTSAFGMAYSGTGVGVVPASTFYIRMGGAASRDLAVTSFDSIVRITFGTTATTLGSGIDLNLNGGVIADSTGTITLDDNTQVNGALSASGQIISTATGGGENAGIGAESITPAFYLKDTDATADEQIWDIIGSNSQFRIRALNDASLTASTALQITRTAATVSSVVIGTPWATVTATALTLASGVDLNLNGGVIADSTGTITLDDNTSLVKASPTLNIIDTGGARAQVVANGVLQSFVSFWSSSVRRVYLINEDNLFRLNAYDAAGTFIDRPLEINTLSGGTITLARDILLASGVDLTLNGGVIADSTGTITFDDNVDINGGTIDGITVFTMSGTTTGIVGPIITNASVDPAARCGFSLVNDLGFVSRTFMYRYASSASAYGLSGPLILGNVPNTPIGFVVANLLKATIESSSLTLSSGVGLTLNGGVIADTTGTITLDDPVQLFSSAGAASAADTLKIDSTTKSFSGYTAGIAGEFNRKLASGYSARTQTGIVSNVTLVPASIDGTVTMPANYFVPGRVIRYRLSGTYTTDVAPGNATIRILIGGTVFRTTGSFALDASITGGVWVLEGCITCYSAGASGQFQGVMFWQHRQAGAGGTPFHVQEATSAAAVSIDTTISNAIGFDWTADDAGTSITVTCFFLEEA